MIKIYSVISALIFILFEPLAIAQWGGIELSSQEETQFCKDRKEGRNFDILSMSEQDLTELFQPCDFDFDTRGGKPRDPVNIMDLNACVDPNDPVLKNLSKIDSRENVSSIVIKPYVSVDFSIKFANGRNKIDHEYLSQLKNISKILNNSKEYGILIEGHANRTGNENHNLEISCWRAAAVREAFREGGVSENRMKYITGYGSARPKDKTQPKADINRRITIMMYKLNQ